MLAQTNEEYAQAQNVKHKSTIEQYRQDVLDIQQQVARMQVTPNIAQTKDWAFDKQKQYQARIESGMQGNQAAKRPRVLIFVSFSMSDKSLKNWMHDAQATKSSLAVRGPIDGSLQKTFTKIGELVKESRIGGVQIDPVAFKKYGIEKVPAVVVKQSVDDDAKFDVIYGNVGLHGALTQIAEEGEFGGDVAKEVLNQWR